MLVNLKSKSQVTIPKPIVEQLNLKPGDKLEFTMEEDRIIIKPVVIIDRAQAWFYTSEWQESEKKVDRQIKEGKIHSAESLDGLYKKLNI
jgi:AbrB family looped-hinge helix DNA binding protein